MYRKSKYTLFTLSLLLSCSLFSFAAEPDNTPGVAPTDAQAGGTRPGSVLFYNLYSSGAGDANHNTQISLTNTHPTRAAFVQFFFIDGSSCAVADVSICLTPNQTFSFLTSDVDPGTTGYIMAVATAQETGVPISFNYFVGSEYVKLPTGHAAKLPAETIAANFDGAFPLPRPNNTEAELKFNGRQYGRLPRVLALESIGSPVTGNRTLLVLNSPSGKLATGTAPFRGFFGTLYDDAENAFAFLQAVNKCQFIARNLDDSFPNTTPAFSQNLLQGRTGWMRLWATNERPLIGAAIRLNQAAATDPNSFNGGANLPQLRLAETASVTIPVFPPTC